MQTVKVDLGERSYPIHIGEGLLDQPQLLAPHIAGRQVAIVTNTTVAPLYLERLTRSLAQFSVLPIILPDGESFKNWETLQLIFDGLLTARHDRRTTVIALGGGVVGAHHGHLGPQFTGGLCVQQSLQETAGAGDQHGDAEGHGRQPSAPATDLRLLRDARTAPRVQS